jgi:hypothetical protein
MAETNRQFWYFAGVALILIALAVSWRIIQPGQGVTLQGNTEGVSVSLTGVQQNITAAQQTIAQLTQQAQAQTTEIEQLEQSLVAEQNRINQLLAQLQSTAQAPAVKRSIEAFRAAQPAQPLPPIRRVDPKLLSEANTRLQQASSQANALAAQLSRAR